MPANPTVLLLPVFAVWALESPGPWRRLAVTATADEANAIIDAYREPFLSIAVLPVRDRRLVEQSA